MVCLLSFCALVFVTTIGIIPAFMVLKDLYKVIQVMFDTGHYTYKVLPCPFSFRADEVLLKQLGFDVQEIQNIFGSLEAGIGQPGTTDDCGFSPFFDDTTTCRDTAFRETLARVLGTDLAAKTLGAR